MNESDTLRSCFHPCTLEHHPKFSRLVSAQRETSERSSLAGYSEGPRCVRCMNGRTWFTPLIHDVVRWLKEDDGTRRCTCMGLGPLCWAPRNSRRSETQKRMDIPHPEREVKRVHAMPAASLTRTSVFVRLHNVLHVAASPHRLSAPPIARCP